MYSTHINSKIKEEDFIDFYKNVLNKNQYIIVIENNNKIVGSGTLLIEQKLTYGGCKLGHIENILIDKNEKGKYLGTTLVNKLVDVANKHKCYRIDLICTDKLIKFYEKMKFKTQEQKAMSIILEHNFS
jgi:glucosamine-phosphate N-acetyltransferase